MSIANREQRLLETALGKGPTLAAEYIRMSTDNQRYSRGNQAKAIGEYAEAHGIQVVRTYCDAGKSGLTYEGRDALKLLLSDVLKGGTDFSLILVYDVSRWGRFQDVDEAAHYEFLCRQAGVRIEYCAEPFDNDGSPLSSMQKNLKRAMAGEYSRELSVKCHAGLMNLARRGYRLGGPASYGLRRAIIDRSGKAARVLEFGEHKSAHSDRLTLIPGPEAEVRVVKQIFHMFVKRRFSEKKIIDTLNRRGILNERGKPWILGGSLGGLLTNEAYIGNAVWNKTRSKLKSKVVPNPESEWIRIEGAYQPIIERAIFEAAQARINARPKWLSSEEMLRRLKLVYEAEGHLTVDIMRAAKDVPDPATYASRFGSIYRAYALVGFTPKKIAYFREARRQLRGRCAWLFREILDGFERAGAHVDRDVETDTLTINHEFTLAVVLARCGKLWNGVPTWRVPAPLGPTPDILLVVRLIWADEAPLDYYAVPRDKLGILPYRLTVRSAFPIECYRLQSLQPLFDMGATTDIGLGR
ncbi:MAG TPA: recombinase family protein [Magnetospirillaceae bacterium]|jgi:DNA invertase Pin-like site-specific DNA recombinase